MNFIRATVVIACLLIDTIHCFPVQNNDFNSSPTSSLLESILRRTLYSRMEGLILRGVGGSDPLRGDILEAAVTNYQRQKRITVEELTPASPDEEEKIEKLAGYWIREPNADDGKAQEDKAKSSSLEVSDESKENNQQGETSTTGPVALAVMAPSEQDLEEAEESTKVVSQPKNVKLHQISVDAKDEKASEEEDDLESDDGNEDFQTEKYQITDLLRQSSEGLEEGT